MNTLDVAPIVERAIAWAREAWRVQIEYFLVDIEK